MGNKKPEELIFCGCGCKELLTRFDSYGRERRYKHGHHSRKEELANHVKGYKYVKCPEEYKHLANKDGYVFEHRLVWEQNNNACLLPWIDVHHLNEIKTDNRIENLEAITKTKHCPIHVKKDLSNRSCLLCGNKTYIRRNGVEQWHRYGNDFICEKCHKKCKGKNC